MQNEKDTENIYITQEKTGFDQFLYDLKQSTFSVIYVLLKEEDSSILGVFFENITDYLQLLQFIFNQKIQTVWKADDVLNTIFTIGNFFAIAQYFSGTFTWTLYLVVFYFCIFCIILTVLDIIYVSYSFNRQRFSVLWPLVVLRSVVTLSVTVLFLPVTEFLIGILQCETDPETGKMVLESYPEIQCWAGIHILHASVAILNII